MLLPVLMPIVLKCASIFRICWPFSLFLRARTYTHGQITTTTTTTDVKLKDAAKKIGKQFACGSSVSKAPSGAEEIVIQGDVLMDLPDYLEATFNVSGGDLIDGRRIHLLTLLRLSPVSIVKKACSMSSTKSPKNKVDEKTEQLPHGSAVCPNSVSCSEVDDSLCNHDALMEMSSPGCGHSSVLECTTFAEF